MTSIITITFNPCIDKSMSVPSLIPEKKLRCSFPKLEPGGGGINVARAIKKLGGEAIAIYPSGGYTGKFFNQLMNKENIPSIVIETENETRENIIVLDESTNQQYRFCTPGSELNEREWQRMLYEIEAVKDPGYIVASGSLPPGLPPDIFARIANLAKKKRAKLIVDTSGEALRHALLKGVYLIKPNLNELASLVKKENLSKNEIVPVARQIIQDYQCKVIITSIGAEGAILITKDFALMITPPPAKIKSTVGAGDSMVAGIVYSLSKGKDIKEAAQYGVACGTAATMNPGTELCRLEDAEMLFSLVRSLPENMMVNYDGVKRLPV